MMPISTSVCPRTCGWCRISSPTPWNRLASGLRSASDQPTRFNEIKRQLDGVTQRVLTQTLRRLERNGLIRRRILETSPIGVEYSLTPLGKSFRGPFIGLLRWTIEHSAEVVAAQNAYDERSAR